MLSVVVEQDTSRPATFPLLMLTVPPEVVLLSNCTMSPGYGNLSRLPLYVQFIGAGSVSFADSTHGEAAGARLPGVKPTDTSDIARIIHADQS